MKIFPEIIFLAGNLKKSNNRRRCMYRKHRRGPFLNFHVDRNVFVVSKSWWRLKRTANAQTEQKPFPLEGILKVHAKSSTDILKLSQTELVSAGEIS